MVSDSEMQALREFFSRKASQRLREGRYQTLEVHMDGQPEPVEVRALDPHRSLQGPPEAPGLASLEIIYPPEEARGAETVRIDGTTWVVYDRHSMGKAGELLTLAMVQADPPTSHPAPETVHESH